MLGLKCKFEKFRNINSNKIRICFVSVPAIRHDFGERSDMTVSGNLRQWPV